MEHRVSSPRTSPVRFRDAIDELLRFTLDSHLNGSLGIHLGLSHTFCSHLLLTTTENPCPLYKHLASILGEFVGTDNEGHSLKNRDECTSLVMEKGSELVHILKTVNFELHVREPFFAQLRDGSKLVEGRCAVGDYIRIRPGSVILFNKCLLLEVQEVRWYSSFVDMLEAETLARVLPGVGTIEEGVQVYRNFYSEEKENYNGVLGIHVTKPASQLYFPLAQMLSEMSDGGIQRLLGLSSTDANL